MNLYIENLKESTNNYLNNNKFIKVIRYKINIQKSIVFLYTCNEQSKNEVKKFHLQGFPGGAVVENLPANAGDTGSSPGLGRSHMPRSSWARKPQLLSLRVWSLCPATGGAAIVRGPRTAMKSGPCTAMKSGPHLP